MGGGEWNPKWGIGGRRSRCFAPACQQAWALRDTARSAGLHYVYLGNLRGVPEAETSFCPNCRKPVIERDVFAVTHNRLVSGGCPQCRTRIAGGWTA